MRILLVGNYELDGQQSMQRYASWLLGALRARGQTVVLIRPVAIFSKLAVGPLRRGAVAKYLGYLDKYLIFPGQLRQAARQFDLVHICDHSNSMYLKAAAGKPAVITCHDVLAIRSALGEFSATKTAWAGRRLQAWILRGLRDAGNVICVSHKTAEDLQRLTGPGGSGETGTEKIGSRVTVILNPLNWPYKHRQVMPSGLRERLGIGAGQAYFLHVGGNQWYKNRPAVVRIFAELRERSEFAGAKLVMAGKPFPTALRKLVAENGLTDCVIETVDATNEELEALYSHAVALIFPSLEEGFGWPIVEAQACGCPVAVTDRAPMTEVGGECAIAIDPGDPAAAAAAIAQALGRRAALVACGLENVQRFRESAIVERYLSYYGTVAGM